VDRDGRVELGERVAEPPADPKAEAGGVEPDPALEIRNIDADE